MACRSYVFLCGCGWSFGGIAWPATVHLIKKNRSGFTCSMKVASHVRAGSVTSMMKCGLCLFFSFFLFFFVTFWLRWLINIMSPIEKPVILASDFYWRSASSTPYRYDVIMAWVGIPKVPLWNFTLFRKISLIWYLGNGAFLSKNGPKSNEGIQFIIVQYMSSCEFGCRGWRLKDSFVFDGFPCPHLYVRNRQNASIDHFRERLLPDAKPRVASSDLLCKGWGSGEPLDNNYTSSCILMRILNTMMINLLG